MKMPSVVVDVVRDREDRRADGADVSVDLDLHVEAAIAPEHLGRRHPQRCGPAGADGPAAQPGCKRRAIDHTRSYTPGRRTVHLCLEAQRQGDRRGHWSHTDLGQCDDGPRRFLLGVSHKCRRGVTTNLSRLVIDVPNSIVVGWPVYDRNSPPQVAPIPAGVRAVASGWGNVAVKLDGTVVQWDSFGQTYPVPTGLADVVSVVASGSHALALKANGTVVIWGYSSLAQQTLPSDLTDVVALATSSTSAFALKADGTVVGWGPDYTLPPAGLFDVVDISAGPTFGTALKADGTVVAWGTNNFGETSVPTNLTDVVQIASGRYHTVALRADGTATTFGAQSILPSLVVPDSLQDITAVYAGSDLSYALRSTARLSAGAAMATPPPLLKGFPR